MPFRDEHFSAQEKTKKHTKACQIHNFFVILQTNNKTLLGYAPIREV